MWKYLLVIIISIFLWEALKDILNIGNIFDKYYGLSGEEALTARRAEEKKTEKKREAKKNTPKELIDD